MLILKNKPYIRSSSDTNSSILNPLHQNSPKTKKTDSESIIENPHFKKKSLSVPLSKVYHVLKYSGLKVIHLLVPHFLWALLRSYNFFLLLSLLRLPNLDHPHFANKVTTCTQFSTWLLYPVVFVTFISATVKIISRI